MIYEAECYRCGWGFSKCECGPKRVTFDDIYGPICPHCGESMSAADDPDMFKDGEHVVICEECEKEFVVLVETQAVWRSRFNTERDNGR